MGYRKKRGRVDQFKGLWRNASEDDRAQIERALPIWRAARPISGTLAEAYLASSGINPDKLLTNPPGWPETLAWHDEQRAPIVAGNDASGTGLREAGKALAYLRKLPQIATARVMSTEVLGTDAAALIEEAADV
jgi:hypothetical protein